MEDKSFKNLKVWQKSYQLTLEIFRLTRGFPREESFAFANQIRRSSLSVSANIAEGYKKTRKDFLRFLDIAQGSLEETKNYLMLSKDLGYCSEETMTALLDLSNEIGKMLYGLKRVVSERLNTKITG
jgi:four helix bundle protein